jgi:hypothetical protein
MQTTVTIDPDVEILLKGVVSEQRRTVDEVVNDALRLALSGEPAAQRKPYVLQPRRLGIRTTVNLDKALQVGEELEDQEIIRKLHEGR